MNEKIKAFFAKVGEVLIKIKDFLIKYGGLIIGGVAAVFMFIFLQKWKSEVTEIIKPVEPKPDDPKDQPVVIVTDVKYDSNGNPISHVTDEANKQKMEEYLKGIGKRK
jgi:hypothetical protein